MPKFDKDKKPKKLSRRRAIIYLITSFVFGFIIIEVVSEIVLFDILGVDAFTMAFPASFTVFTFLSFSSSPCRSSSSTSSSSSSSSLAWKAFFDVEKEQRSKA